MSDRWYTEAIVYNLDIDTFADSNGDGVGDIQGLLGRQSIRTPMQWSSLRNAGFSGAVTARLVRPVISEGEFGYENVNVTRQRQDPNSLLGWFERMIRTLREAPESPLAEEAVHPNDVLADRDYPDVGGLESLELAGYGYRWIRIRRTP